MKNNFSRRDLLQAGGIVGAGVWLNGLASTAVAAEPAKATPNTTKLGWRVACCAYTFRHLSFLEAVEQIAALGLNEVEGFAWQKLSKENPTVKTNEAMPEYLRKETKQRLAELGVRMSSWYVGSLPAQEAAARPFFEFAQQMGIETIVSEPDPTALDALGKLCDQHQINLAIHNHPKPSRYWDPATLAKLCRDRTPRIGCCADTGHWCRSGVKPVEALRLLEGRLIAFHLKDVETFGEARAHDCPWGTGQGDIAGILKEVHRQKAKPVFGIEYERGGNILADLRQCLAYLEKIASELGG
jgi:sugar phosphate isomerase/epimerase